MAKLKADAHMIDAKINLARSNADGVMLVVTGSGCTSCGFNTTATLQSQTAALAVNTANWVKLGFASPPLDPWGNPYTFDENEHEGSTSNCLYDAIYSAGPNGIFGGNAGGANPPRIVYAGYGDDFYFNVTHFRCP